MRREEAVIAKHAKGTFQLTGFDEETYQKLAGKAKLTKARITQDFTGDMQAKGTWESVMCYQPDGTALYRGIQRMVGSIDGHRGSFVVVADGTFDGDVARSTWTVVEGLATGGLKGLRGKGESAAPHGPNGTYTLEYEFD